MSDFMHCNTCYVQPSAQGIPAYFLTTCYHILCKGCLQKETGDPRLCPVCKHEMNAVEINSAMDPKLQNLFKEIRGPSLAIGSSLDSGTIVGHRIIDDPMAKSLIDFPGATNRH
ncbi:unnamed protein product [Nippostrongylus brasiliensis]|uniref:RING-type domain-containing protein n=1 Tax=Nippostrongylus brasiliensis TaxID=27835 RepID=A0A0N4YXT0_NIPBR|nr:unnamed protein product [Nippostrongylus brasiliensis]